METKMIGSKIAESRKKINISQAQLAESLFISPQAVGKWERGESLPDLLMFTRLAKILGVDLNYFSDDFPSMVEETKSAESRGAKSQENGFENQAKKPLWNMSSGNWVDADFSGLHGLHEKFSSSNMQRCLFRKSDLSGLLLSSNNVLTCDFSESMINNSRIRHSNLSNNQFNACSLKETVFSGSHVSGCDFTGADASGVEFTSGGFEKNTLVNVIWKRCSFKASYLADLVFEGTLEDCSFENCSFTRVTFKGAKLINTFFKNRSLKRVSFIDCKVDHLTYAFLKNGKADLSGITLLDS